ncbi:MAG: DUF4129 domain-containing protein [Candidatus Limnocylindrales bacterium]
MTADTPGIERPLLPEQARLAEAVPVALAIVAEAAWLSILGGVIQLVAHRDPVLGIPALAAFVVAGFAAARIVGPRAGRRWPWLAAAIVMAGAIGGTLVHPEARAALVAAAPDLATILGHHPAGLVAGLAVLRGMARAGPGADGDSLRRLLGVGIVGLSLTAAAGGMIAEPFRSRFLADTFAASILFAASASVAVALARQEESATDPGVHWYRNPAWVLLVVFVTLVGAVIAIPAVDVVIPATRLLLGVGFALLLLAGLLAGWNRATLRTFALIVAGGIVLVLILRAFAAPGNSPQSIPVGSGVAGSTPSSPVDPTVLQVGGLVALVVAVLGIVIAVRLWMRPVASLADDSADVRTIDRGAPRVLRARRRSRFGTREAPLDAIAAYRALVAWLADRPALARGATETPGEHARRLRRAGRGSLSLDLLAADYVLAEFGGAALPRREDRRAIDRFRRLRRIFGREPRAADLETARLESRRRPWRRRDRLSSEARPTD